MPAVPGIIGMPSVQRPSRELMPCIPIRHLTSLYCPASQSIGMHGTNPGTVRRKYFEMRDKKSIP